MKLWRTSMLLALLMVCMALALTAQAELVRLDQKGYLYYLDYSDDYYSDEVLSAVEQSGWVGVGCSCFFTHNPSRNPLTCRNYDWPHRVADGNRALTGLNVVLHCRPEGLYESIAVADAMWCDPEDPNMRQGGPDLPDFDEGKLKILPWQTMDGINQKGLCVNLLRLDIKEGDDPGLRPVGASMLVRELLDHCANVYEAAAWLRDTEITPEIWQGCHLFVTDAWDRSVVFESRNGRVSVVDTDIVTNFYVGSDDMEDSYKYGNLREEAVRIADEAGASKYRFGYGHGYHRFVTIAGQLERYRDLDSEAYRTIMPESQALVVLQSVAQNPWTNAAGTSMTQYSAIYNNTQRTVEVWSWQDYRDSCVFDVQGNRRDEETEP